MKPVLIVALALLGLIVLLGLWIVPRTDAGTGGAKTAARGAGDPTSARSKPSTSAPTAAAASMPQAARSEAPSVPAVSLISAARVAGTGTAAPPAAVRPAEPPAALHPDAEDAVEDEEADEGDEAEDEADARRYAVDREGIRAAVRASQPKLVECYEGWRQADQKLAGTLKLTFTIAPPPPGELGQPSAYGQGEARTAVIRQVSVVHSELGNLAMEGCALNAMSGLRFEAPESEVVVNYPLVFSGDSEEVAPQAPAP